MSRADASVFIFRPAQCAENGGSYFRYIKQKRWPRPARPITIKVQPCSVPALCRLPGTEIYFPQDSFLVPKGERLLRRDKLQKGAHFLRCVVSLKKSFKICIARFRVFLAVVQHSVMFKSVFLHTFIIFVCWLQRHEKL
jgi:hypothetical protein